MCAEQAGGKVDQRWSAVGATVSSRCAHMAVQTRHAQARRHRITHTPLPPPMSATPPTRLSDLRPSLPKNTTIRPCRSLLHVAQQPCTRACISPCISPGCPATLPPFCSTASAPQAVEALRQTLPDACTLRATPRAHAHSRTQQAPQLTQSWRRSCAATRWAAMPASAGHPAAVQTRCGTRSRCRLHGNRSARRTSEECRVGYRPMCGCSLPHLKACRAGHCLALQEHLCHSRAVSWALAARLAALTTGALSTGALTAALTAVDDAECHLHICQRDGQQRLVGQPREQGMLECRLGEPADAITTCMLAELEAGRRLLKLWPLAAGLYAGVSAVQLSTPSTSQLGIAHPQVLTNVYQVTQ